MVSLIILSEMDNVERRTAIEWLIQQATSHHLRQYIIHQAIMIFDKYMVSKVETDNINGIALMSLYLSLKLDDVDIIGLDEITDSIFTENDYNQLRKIEMDTLEKLKYHVYTDTIYQYINVYHNISSNYIFSCALAMMLLTKIDYQYVAPEILAEKIIDFTNLLKMGDVIIETMINADILYSYIYLSWKEYCSSGYTAIQQYYLKERKYDIFSVTIPQINCIYQTSSIRDQRSLSTETTSYLYNYPKKLFNRKVVISKLGTPGTYGSVSKVKLNNKLIALKKIKCNNDYEEDGFYYCMLRELNILFRLHHPNITNIDGFYYDVDKLTLYIGMDLMDMTVREHIKTNSVPDSTKFSYINQLLLGLSYIHSQNVMHRDLSTNNVLVSNGTLKISDFGTSRYFRHLDFRAKYTNLVCTLYYRPIEVLLGKVTYSYKMDIWSSACVIYFILLGTDLFPGDSEIDMIFRIFKILGTPADQSHLCTLPKFKASLPKWDYAGISGLEPKQAAVLYQMLDYDEEKRINASEALGKFILAT